LTGKLPDRIKVQIRTGIRPDSKNYLIFMIGTSV